jgi:putative Holliday junction resolvase
LRVLGVDFGSKRIGIAVGESEFGIVSPRPNLLASGTLAKDAAAIAELARRETVEKVVVGIPVNPEDPRMERVCGRLAEEIGKLGLVVETVDEAMTSVQAEARMGELKGSQVRKRKDGEAACQIVERYFAESGPA